MKEVEGLPLKGYVAISETRTGIYLCVPRKDAEDRNLYTEEAVIYNQRDGMVSEKMQLQIAFKWMLWYEC